MPLLDHFHPPLSTSRHWESFHHAWATRIAARLNEVLPSGYLAEPHVHHGAGLEIDVAALEQGVDPVEPPGSRRTLRTIDPGPPTATLAATFPDHFEVRIHRTVGGSVLVAAVELVSPSNKDRPEERRAFVGKCLSYLSEGIGIAVVDVVTRLRARLFDEIVGSLDPAATGVRLPEACTLWAASWRPVRTDDTDRAEVWLRTLRVGDRLPDDLPLWLDPATPVGLELETSYAEVCRQFWIDMDRLASAPP